MAQVRRPNPLGRLLRTRRRATRTGFKQIAAATGVDPETLRKWEVGDIYELPLRGALRYARTVGITLEELEAAALSAEAVLSAPEPPPAVIVVHRNRADLPSAKSGSGDAASAGDSPQPAAGARPEPRRRSQGKGRGERA